MITVSEQRFLERVPNLLADISRSLESPKINWEQRRYEIANSSLSINNKNQEHNE